MRKGRLVLCLFWVLVFANAHAQQRINGRDGAQIPTFELAHLPEITDELTPSFFVANRERLRDTIPDSSVVVLFSAPLKSRSNDIDYRYHQDPDFYYFSGIRQSNSMLLIFKNPIRIDGQWMRELLLIEKENPKKEQWTGTMLSFEEASELSLVPQVYPNTSFKTLDVDWGMFSNVFSNRHQHIERDDKEHPGDLSSLVSHFDRKMERAGQEVQTPRAEDIFAFLRQKKTASEIQMIQRAVDITCMGQENAIRSMVPEMTEYQIEAVIQYTFRANGAEGEAFPSIVASGDNGAIMHYTSNNALLIPGDMVVMDIGAQYQGYAADVTRTVPVSGVFSEEQKSIYQLVLNAQKVAIRYATPGYKFWTPHEEAYRTIGKGLISLGVIKEWNEIEKYFIHGTSHYLGLDVHDPGVYSALAPGDVITVEPGVYIPEGSKCDPKWWGIHVRIEDDILITNGEARVLSDCVPKEIADIEAMMKKEP